MTTKAEIAAWVAGYDRDFNQLCVALIFQAIARFGARPSASYDDANLAYQAARIDGTDMDHAPGGAIGYHRGGAHGDVSVSMGDGSWLHASAHFTAGEMLRPGDHVGFLTDAEYRRRSGYVARGWSHNFGSHPSFTVEAAPALDPDTGGGSRVVGAAVGRVRVGPNLNSPVGRLILKDLTIRLTGFIRGESTAGSAIWFGLTSGGYAHSSLFTDPSTNGLADLKPVELPPVVVAPPVVVDPPVAVPPVVLPPIIAPIGDPPVSEPTIPTTPVVVSVKTYPTKAELDAAVEALKAAGVNASAGLPGGVLAGLFSGHTVARRRVYFTSAITSLVISFGPDIALAGFLTGHQLTVFTASLTLAASLLLKINTALGFVAASNTR